MPKDARKKRKKILLIDDERDLCTMVKFNLERTGEYAVAVCYSGPEGVQKTKEESFDLILTDFAMPGMDGGAVLSAVKAIQPDTPVVLFSVYHDDSTTITPELAAKAAGIISKPIEHERLYETLQAALRHSGGDQ